MLFAVCFSSELFCNDLFFEQVLQLAAARSAEATRQSSASDWLWINRNSNISGNSVLTPASTPTTATGTTSTTANPTSSRDNGAPHHRVLLRPRLAGRPGDWEEGSPEDLILTLEQSTSLAVAVLHQVSSRVRAKCEPATASLRASCTQMLSLAAQAVGNSPTVGTLNGTRCVISAVVQALQHSGVSLLAPVVFGSTKGAESLGAELGAALSAVYPVKPNDSSVMGQTHSQLKALSLAALSAVSSHFDTPAVTDAVHKSLCEKVFPISMSFLSILRLGFTIYLQSLFQDNIMSVPRLQFLLRVVTEGAAHGATAGRSTQREKLGQMLVTLLEKTRYTSFCRC